MRKALYLLPLVSMLAMAAPNGNYANIAGREVAVWKPAGPAPPEGYPVIVFSHGFTGCATQSTFLMDALAQNGYLVLAPNHKDSTCKGGSRQTLLKMIGKRPEERFADQGNWTPETYRDRREDIEAVINDLSRSHEVDGVKADVSRLGLAGHSLGGYTVLGLAGAWPSWKDPRVKAVLALSPYCAPFIAHGDLRQMDVPVMYQGGTADAGITPTVKGPDGAYARTGGQKFFVEFRGAGHLAWTDLNKRYQDQIDRYSVAFFNRYLKGGEDHHGQLLSLMGRSKARPRQVAEVETDVEGASGHGPRK